MIEHDQAVWMELRDALQSGELLDELGFRQSVWAVVRAIPSGKVLGYGDVAGLMGSPRAARQVGYALAALPYDNRDVPWWRVLRSNGTIAMQGDPSRGPNQIALLEAEGVDTQAKPGMPGVDMDVYRWRPSR
jgi:methylated-DNA-protein-cysteine methyltransferase-like protein